MRIGVMVSGGGTNLQAIIDAKNRGEMPGVDIEVVISNKPDALPSSEFLGEEALGKYCCHFRGTRLQLFGQSGCGPSTRCSGGVCG